MKYDPNNHHRRSIRLQEYDYSQTGAYFVTICTKNRECLFGNISNGTMVLNDTGRIVQKCWNEIDEHFPHITLDEFIVMPNHAHGILLINKALNTTVRAKNFSPLPQMRQPHGTSKTIGSIIRGFKIGVTKWIRKNNATHDVWQRNYYEHIIRNDNELNLIRQYIIINPSQWESDKENPNAKQVKQENM
ncbi:MAG: transposase [Pseudomonadota bacterium]